MFENIIIKKEKTITWEQVWHMVHKVIQGGRISNGGRSYCSVTTFGRRGTTVEYVVYATANKKSDTFIIMKKIKRGYDELFRKDNG